MSPFISKDITLSIEASEAAVALNLKLLKYFANWLLRRTIPPRRVTIAIAGCDTDPLASALLSWAVQEATQCWNKVANGWVEFEVIRERHCASLVIQASYGPAAGTRMAALLPKWPDSGPIGARTTALIPITLRGAEPQSLYTSPEELRYYLEHELGHVIGFEDCRHPGGIMSGVEWGSRWPRPGNFEREVLLAIIARLRKVSTKIGYVRVPKVEEDCAVGAAKTVSMSSSLEELYQHVPFWMKHIWDGEKIVASGNSELGIEYFEEVVKRYRQGAIDAELRCILTRVIAGEIVGYVERLKHFAMNVRTPSQIGQASYLHGVLEAAYRGLAKRSLALEHRLIRRYHIEKEELKYLRDCIRISGLRALPLIPFRVFVQRISLLIAAGRLTFHRILSRSGLQMFE